MVPVSFLEGKLARCSLSEQSHLHTITTDPYQEEFQWLESCRDSETTNTWPGFHSRRTQDVPMDLTRCSVLPLFREQASTMSMMLHSMDIVSKATQHVNGAQVPVLVWKAADGRALSPRQMSQRKEGRNPWCTRHTLRELAMHTQ